jgi:kynureninase
MQLHPLLAWWALLFALSMLARYEPAGWTGYLNVDISPHAVALEAALGQALDICPQLILHAIRAAGS